MKIAYFDCFAGASGDMILGAIIDAGLDIENLKEELSKLNLKGYSVHAEKTTKKGISGTKFHVISSHDHHHRGLKDILEIIDGSTLKESIKDRSRRIFQRLAEAEAKIHNKTVNEIHFHEVGAVDAIIDVVGAAIGLECLGIQCVHTSRIHVGTGSLQCAHGTLPVPPPATLELLKDVPVYSTGIENELVTPTGAAILTTFSKNFGALPSMQIDKTGYGLGGRDLHIPNLIRVVIGEQALGTDEDTIHLIETNIDDMNPQFYEHIMESLFSRGARDVFLTPIIMKKNRPGVVLSVLASPDQITELIDVVFQETTTLGVRISEVKKRKILKRDILTVTTPWGDARVKIRTVSDTQKTVAPEYDDCKRLARENNIPIHEVYDKVRKIVEAEARTKR